MGVVQIHGDGLAYRGRYDPDIVLAIQGMAGREWIPKQSIWTFPAEMPNVAVLSRFPEVRITAEVWNLVNRREMALAAVMKIKDAEIVTPLAHMPIKIEPFQHQIKAFNIAMRMFEWLDND